MIQNHLTSQPLSKRLKELKVPQKSYFYWVRTHKNGWGVDKWYAIPPDELKSTIDFVQGKHTSAFLSSELGELMPEQTICRRTFIQTTQSWVWEVEVIGLKESTTKPIFSSSMAEAMGLMLEHLILNGLIKI